MSRSQSLGEEEDVGICGRCASSAGRCKQEGGGRAGWKAEPCLQALGLGPELPDSQTGRLGRYRNSSRTVQTANRLPDCPVCHE